jgi:glycosyltransferase involved in cell wall biosynthesis
MRLAYITNASLTDGWAHSVQIANMCSSFAQAGAEVTLFVPYRKQFSNNDIFDFYKLPRNFKVKFLPCIDLFFSNPSPFLYWLRFISFYISARVYVWFHKFDVLYSRDLYSVVFFPSIVIEQHSFPSRVSFLHKFFLKRINKLVTLTSYIKQDYVRTGVKEDKIFVAQSAVDLSKFEGEAKEINISGISAGDFVYGYIGTLKTMGMEKGVKIGLEVLKYLPLNFKFLIVGGEKPDIEYYVNIAKEYGVEDRAVFIGQVAYSDIYSYSQKCDVFIAPFPDFKHYSYFMSPLKIFEYMASKKPIISTLLPTILEVLQNEKNSILVPPNDVQSVVNAIKYLSENPNISMKLAESAYNDVIEFTWDKRAEKILKFVKI